jgi:hypothetical protein
LDVYIPLVDEDSIIKSIAISILFSMNIVNLLD